MGTDDLDIRRGTAETDPHLVPQDDSGCQPCLSGSVKADVVVIEAESCLSPSFHGPKHGSAGQPSRSPLPERSIGHVALSSRGADTELTTKGFHGAAIRTWTGV